MRARALVRYGYQPLLGREAAFASHACWCCTMLARLQVTAGDVFRCRRRSLCHTAASWPPAGTQHQGLAQSVLLQEVVTISERDRGEHRNKLRKAQSGGVRKQTRSLIIIIITFFCWQQT